MKRVLAFLSLAAAVAAIVSGCGSADARVTKSDYEAQVGSVDFELFQALRAVGAARTVKSTVGALEKCQVAFAHAAKELEAITPPKDVEAEHQSLATGVREFGEQLNPIIARVAGGNRLAIASVQSMPAMTKIIRATADITHKGYVLRSGG